MATDKYRALALEVNQLPQDGKLLVLAGDVPLVEGTLTREIQGDIAYAPRPRTAEETAALEALLFQYEYGPLDVQAALLEGSANPAASLMDGLFAAYPLVADANDAHGSNDLTNVSVTFVAPGGTKPANMGAGVARFSGTPGARLSATGLAAVGAAGNGLSWSVWFRTNMSAAVALKALITRSGNPAGYKIGLNQNTIGRFSIYSANAGAGGTSVQPPSQGTMNDSQWHHAVLVWRPATRMLHGFNDGVEYSAPVAGTLDLISASTVEIGFASAFATQNYGENTVAEMGEAVAWDRPLTNNEAALLFDGGAGRFYPYA